MLRNVAGTSGADVICCQLLLKEYNIMTSIHVCISGSPIVGQMFFRATLFTSYYQVKRAVCCYSAV